MRYIVSLILLSLLSGCISNNVKRYKPDYAHKTQIEQQIPKKINVSVSMPEGNRDAILCRMAGNIYLPNKMTYASYIADALEKALKMADRYDNTSGSPVLQITLNKVDFSSTAGKWYIEGTAQMGNQSPISIKSVTKFGTSWDAISACQNVASAYEEAVGNFIEEILIKTKW